MKKIWILLVISLMALGLFTACASNADTMPSASPSTSPSVSPSTSPSMAPSTAPAESAMPAASASPAAEAGANTVEDVQRLSDQVSEEVEKLSELKGAEAIVAGTIAVVGLEYDTQYQGGLTDRLKEMVQSRVESIDKAVTTVHVKDDEATMEKLRDLREKLSNQAITFSQLQTQVLDLADTSKG